MMLDYLENNFIFHDEPYNEFGILKLTHIKDNQNFEKNYKSLLFKIRLFNEKSLIKNKIVHFYDFFTVNEFESESILIYSKDEYFKIPRGKKAHFRILTENPKLSKYQIVYLKYMIFNHQELKEKILDFENILGDLNKISPKDFEILNDI